MAWLRVRKFAEKYRIHKQTVISLAKAGKIPAFQAGKVWMVADIGDEILLKIGVRANQSLEDLPLLKAREVEALLHIGPTRTRALIKSGDLHPQKFASNIYMYSVADVRRYMLKRAGSGQFRGWKKRKAKAVDNTVLAWASKALGVDTPPPPINYNITHLDELRLIIETIAGLPEVQRAECFAALWRHFEKTGRYIGFTRQREAEPAQPPPAPED